MSSKSRPTQSPSSYTSYSAGAVGNGPMAWTAVISWRNNDGVFGLSDVPTALTKARRPEAVTRRAATPGEKPPCWVAAETTTDPSARSTHARTVAGTSSKGNRTPAACAMRPDGRCPLAPSARRF